MRSSLLGLLGTTALFSLASLHPAHSLPSGGVLQEGTATITPVANGLQINQTTQRAVINWNDFSIGVGKTVEFLQPGRGAAILNRVVGPSLSTIAGTILANGTVFLVNPNGIVVTPTAVINTSSFVASTMDISNANFMTANASDGTPFIFTHAPNAGSITVQSGAQITSDPSGGGLLAFVTPDFTNGGILTAPQGLITVVGGQQVNLLFNLDGTGLINYNIAATPLAQRVAIAQNSTGKISAPGGAVHLEALSQSDIYGSIINLQGLAEAPQLATTNGKLTIIAEKADIRVGDINFPPTFLTASQINISTDAGLVVNNTLLTSTAGTDNQINIKAFTDVGSGLFWGGNSQIVQDTGTITIKANSSSGSAALFSTVDTPIDSQKTATIYQDKGTILIEATGTEPTGLTLDTISTLPWIEQGQGTITIKAQNIGSDSTAIKVGVSGFGNAFIKGGISDIVIDAKSDGGSALDANRSPLVVQTKQGTIQYRAVGISKGTFSFEVQQQGNIDVVGDKFSLALPTNAFFTKNNDPNGLTRLQTDLISFTGVQTDRFVGQGTFQVHPLTPQNLSIDSSTPDPGALNLNLETIDSNFHTLVFGKDNDNATQEINIYGIDRNQNVQLLNQGVLPQPINLVGSITIQDKSLTISTNGIVSQLQPVAAGTLLLQGQGDFSLNDQTNAIGKLSGTAADVALKNEQGILLTDLTVSQNLDVTVTQLQEAGLIQVENQIIVGKQTTWQTPGNIWQKSGTITTPVLTLDANRADIGSSTNAIGQIVATANDGLVVRNKQSLQMESVTITNGDLLVDVAGSLTVNQPLNALNAVLNADQDLLLNAPVSVNGLALVQRQATSNPITLTGTVQTLALDVKSDFTYTGNQSLTLGSVTATVAPVAPLDETDTQKVDVVHAPNITIDVQGGIDINVNVSTETLRTDVTQGVWQNNLINPIITNPIIKATNFIIQGAGNVDVQNLNNDIQVIKANLDGGLIAGAQNNLIVDGIKLSNADLILQSVNGITLNQDIDTGVLGNVYLSTGKAIISNNANIITSGLATKSSDGFVDLRGDNQFQTLAAFADQGITIKNANPYTIGTVNALVKAVNANDTDDQRQLVGVVSNQDFISRSPSLIVREDVTVAGNTTIIADQIQVDNQVAFSTTGLGIQGQGGRNDYNFPPQTIVNFLAWETPIPINVQAVSIESVTSTVNTDIVTTRPPVLPVPPDATDTVTPGSPVLPVPPDARNLDTLLQSMTTTTTEESTVFTLTICAFDQLLEENANQEACRYANPTQSVVTLTEPLPPFQLTQPLFPFATND